MVILGCTGVSARWFDRPPVPVAPEKNDASDLASGVPPVSSQIQPQAPVTILENTLIRVQAVGSGEQQTVEAWHAGAVYRERRREVLAMCLQSLRGATVHGVVMKSKNRQTDRKPGVDA